MSATLDPNFLEALALVPAHAWDRWFGGERIAQSAAPASTRVLVTTFPFPPARGHAALCLFETSLGPTETLLQQAALRRWAGPAPVGARVLYESVDGDGAVLWSLASAWADEGLRDWLREALSAGASIRSDDWEWVAAPERSTSGRSMTGASRQLADRQHDVVLLGDSAVAIAYRRLTRGASAELELLRHLERVPGVRVAPVLFGSAIIRSPSGERTASAILEDIDPDAATVASVLVHRLRRSLEGDPSLQAVALDDVRAVGVATRELHAALGRPFDRGVIAGAIPADIGDVEVWVARAWSTLSAASLAYRHGEHQRTALLDALDVLPGKLQQFGAAAERSPGLIHRIHGNLRLHNVLMSPPRSLCVVEFDGDPALPDRERVMPQSPWRDVARMLVSIAESAAMAAVDAGGDEKALEIAWLWEREARKACLEGYGTGGGALHALLAIFELEFASRLLHDGTRGSTTATVVAAHTLERLSRSIV